MTSYAKAVTLLHCDVTRGLQLQKLNLFEFVNSDFFSHIAQASRYSEDVMELTVQKTRI